MSALSGSRRLLFISNLFPSRDEPYRGLDNATVLHHLRDRWEIRALAVRPTLPWGKNVWQAREMDEPFAPQYVRAPYLPKIGSRVNHLLLARALRPIVTQIRREFPFDVVLSSWIFPDSCAVAQLAREMAFPLVSIAQGSDVHQYLKHAVRRRVIGEMMPTAAAIITRSAELARLLEEAGLAAEKLHPIYNGIDFGCFQPADPAAARAELGLPAEAPIIAFVGNFYAIKNPLNLISAHAQLADRSTCLVMIGGGPLEAEARDLTERLGTGGRVFFPGRLAAAAVARHLQAANVLALPSDNEGVPNVILEAFACGRPVVASRVGGIGEVHHEDFLGRLVPPRDAAALAEGLATVLAQPIEAVRIAEHARQFSWERAAERYHQQLQSALHPTGPSASVP